MSKVVILGAGPAGISAALYTVRAGIETTVIHKGDAGSALGKAHSIENYYGFAEPVSGKELYENGIAGAKRLGVQFAEDEAVALEWNGSFAVETLQGRGCCGLQDVCVPSIFCCAAICNAFFPSRGFESFLVSVWITRPTAWNVSFGGCFCK